ncbi:hypothetical protein CLIB1444_04S04720 [[Candida] jaroonii]|uniref:Uncharacterized protein n=1 Tax=[Candida] jaroonii TaxID=467808 RepID=A0ACA9Y7G0_9ASCO|nr:hypothetical protein CLIB1444_04S04720 [[Candida] jaroonii]
MKRYSIAPPSSRRKSMNPGSVDDSNERLSQAMELEKLEQQITLVLQQIDTNLSKSNSFINDKIFPILRSYSNSCDNVWKNVNYWKYFFEQSANIELGTNESEIPDIKSITENNILLDTETDDLDNKTKQVKKPLFKGTLDESTPTWSTEPQAIRKLESENAQPKVDKSPQKEEVTFNKRKSLDKYQNFIVSPRKKHSSDFERRRRSSIIQDLLNSSPTLPEPPFLESEAYIHSDHRSDKESNLQSEDFEERLRRLNRSPGGLPLTPKLKSTRTSHIKTPIEIKNYDTKAPEVEVETKSDDEPVFPDLETIDIQKKTEEISKKRKLDEDNIFLDDNSRNNSVQSTLYHSMLEKSGEFKPDLGPKPDLAPEPDLSNQIFENIDKQSEQEVIKEDTHSSELGAELQERLNRIIGK